MALVVCNYKASSLLLLIGIVLSMVLRSYSANIQSNRFIPYPKDANVYKARRDGVGGFHEYEYYNYEYLNCGPRYGYFGGYPYDGYGGYPGYGYPGYGGYPFGFNAHYGAPYY